MRDASLLRNSLFLEIQAFMKKDNQLEQVQNLQDNIGATPEQKQLLSTSFSQMSQEVIEQLNSLQISDKKPQAKAKCKP